MSSNRTRRIAKELADIQNDTESQIFCEPDNGSDLSHLKASFPGPPDTPYEGGTYMVDVKIPPDYPFRPPTMSFLTKLWHPNVSSQTGAICLDTLGSAWSPVLTIKSALISLQSLLNSPEPKDPQDAEVATMLLNHPEQFKAKARDWAVRFAGAPKVTAWSQSPSSYSNPTASRSKEDDAKQQALKYQGYNKNLIDRFVVMGFDVERVVEAFKYVHIDRNGGEDYELEEAYMGDITARLLGEP